MAPTGECTHKIWMARAEVRFYCHYLSTSLSDSHRTGFRDSELTIAPFENKQILGCSIFSRLCIFLGNDHRSLVCFLKKTPLVVGRSNHHGREPCTMPNDLLRLLIRITPPHFLWESRSIVVNIIFECLIMKAIFHRFHFSNQVHLCRVSINNVPHSCTQTRKH